MPAAPVLALGAFRRGPGRDVDAEPADVPPGRGVRAAGHGGAAVRASGAPKITLSL